MDIYGDFKPTYNAWGPHTVDSSMKYMAPATHRGSWPDIAFGRDERMGPRHSQRKASLGGHVG